MRKLNEILISFFQYTIVPVFVVLVIYLVVNGVYDQVKSSPKSPVYTQVATYKIVWSASSVDLQGIVSDHLNSGWTVSGSAFISSSPEGRRTFYQPMVRVDSVPAESSYPE